MLCETILDAAGRRGASAVVVSSATSLSGSDLVRAVRARALAIGNTSGIRVVRGDPLEAMIEALALNLAGAVPLLLGPDEVAPVTPARLPTGTAWLRTTGGTTAAPRLIAASDAQTQSAAMTHATLTGLASGATLVLTVPPWTSYGWNAWAGALSAGATVRYLPATSPRALLAALAEDDVAWGCTTPPVVRALARLAASPTRTAASLLTAAAPYPTSEALTVAERHGIPVIDRYGSSEAGPIAQARVPGGPLWPAPGVRVSGDPLVVASPSVALATLAPLAAPIEDEAVDAPFEGVWHTSDGASFESDGSFRLTGRVDHVIKRAGRRVDLAALADAIVALPAVAHARVRARAGALDVDLIAEIVPLPDHAPTSRALAEQLAERLPPWSRPTHIELVPLPADLTKWRSRP